MPITIDSLDHLVLTVADISATCEFYSYVLGMRVQTSAEGRTSLAFGTQKINLHAKGHEFEPKAILPTPGSGDLCFLTNTPLADVLASLDMHQISVVDGPVPRMGATGPILSVYVRDPDGNLIEIANRQTA